MREAPTTIVLDGPPEAEVVLSTVGPVTVRANGRRPERELAWRATRPLAADYRAFTAAEKLVKRMALDPDYTAFVVRHVFGGISNAFRHGRADSGERDQVLFAIVALAGWVDFFLALNAMDALADELSRHLDAAVERGTRELPALPVLT